MTGIAFSTNAGFLNVERGISLTMVAVAWATFRRDALRRRDTRKVSVNRPESDASTARPRQGPPAGIRRRSHRRLRCPLPRSHRPLVTASDDRTVLRNTIVPPFDPKDYITPLASFRNFVKDKKDDNLFVVRGLPGDGRVRLAALDAFNGTNYNMDPDSSGNFSKVGDAKSLNTLADSDQASSPATITPWTSPSRTTRATSCQVGGNHRYELSPGLGRAAPGLYFNSGTDTAVTTKGLSKGDAYSVQVSDPVKLETAS